MILPNNKLAIHKAWLYRMLEGIASKPELVNILCFKGGTCASMLGWLDRFSVDLDFDYVGDLADIEKTRKLLENIFTELGLSVKDSSKNGIQYFLKYESPNPEMRNTLKIDTSFPSLQADRYEIQKLIDIDRFLNCQTKETMFAHKMLAVMGRFKNEGHIAGRDIYDIHHFFMKGFNYSLEVLKEGQEKPVKDFLVELHSFIEKEVTEKVLDEDLNTLLTPEAFKKIRKVIKREVLGFIEGESSKILV